MKKLLSGLTAIYNSITYAMVFLSHFFALGIRVYLAEIFLWAGYLKYSSWETTLYLFEHEYKVPVISPIAAAYLGTAAEIILPFLILIGLGSRVSAIALFFFNVFTVISYPVLMSAEGACMVKDNYLWGILIAIIIFYGPGKISLDYLLQRKACPKYQY